MQLFRSLRSLCSGSNTTNTGSSPAVDPATRNDSKIIGRPDTPADCIFTKEHLQLYKTYLTSIDASNKSPNVAEVACFPTALEYNEYLCSLPLTSAKARKPCAHPRHPSNEPGEFLVNCPVCMYEVCFNFLVMISRKWARRGGPYKPDDLYKTPQRAQQYFQLQKAWHYARMTLANLVELLERQAEVETVWDKQHASEVIMFTMSASKALTMARSTSCDVFESAEVIVETKDLPDLSPQNFKGKEPKKVCFATDAQHHSASRSIGTFHRGTTTYTAGKYTCRSPRGWLDTSVHHSWRASIKQCKLFITNNRSDMESTPPGAAQKHGFLWQYAYSEDVILFLEDYVRSCQLAEQIKVYELFKTCDAILLSEPQVEMRDGKREGPRQVAIIEDVRPFFCVQQSFVEPDENRD